jgi:hypothetical protein
MSVNSKLSVEPSGSGNQQPINYAIAEKMTAMLCQSGMLAEN